MSSKSALLLRSIWSITNHGAKVRESLMSGRWAAAAAVQQGTPGSDWVHWYVVKRADGQARFLRSYPISSFGQTMNVISSER